eukprot:3176311-Rhodomonas_salina.4
MRHMRHVLTRLHASCAHIPHVLTSRAPCPSSPSTFPTLLLLPSPSSFPLSLSLPSHPNLCLCLSVSVSVSVCLLRPAVSQSLSFLCPVKPTCARCRSRALQELTCAGSARSAAT